MMNREYFDTAWEIHESAMQEMEMYQPYGDSPVIVKKAPTLEQAMAFVECAKQKRKYR